MTRVQYGLRFAFVGILISLAFLIPSYLWLPDVTPGFWWKIFIIPAFPTVFITFANGMSGLDPYSFSVLSYEALGVLITMGIYFVMGMLYSMWKRR